MHSPAAQEEICWAAKQGVGPIKLYMVGRADASNVTKGGVSRDPRMMTHWFLDMSASLGLGRDGTSQQIAVGDCNDP